jgi:NADH/NAD ratio-sensing transcriptional regulator Rex
VITDPGSSPLKIIERLAEGGIKGIVNFSTINLTSNRKDIIISNIDLISEFRYLVAMMTLDAQGGTTAKTE